MNTSKFHVLTESDAIALRIVADDGDELAWSGDESAVAARAESSHDTSEAAYAAARVAGGDRWVIDTEGNSHYVRPVV